MIEEATVLNKKKRLPWRDFDGDVVIVDTQTLACLNLNNVASFIWHSIDDSRSCREIIARIVDEFDVEEGAATLDFFTYARELLGKGFVVDAATEGNDS